MTREDAKTMWPLIKAWSEGAELQINFYQEGWKTRDDVMFDSDPEIYRLKPTPKLRPWKPEEVPVGALLRNNAVRFGQPAAVVILAVRGAWVHFIDPETCKITDKICTGFDSSWEHSTDNGKTWKPCGVEDETVA